MITYDRLFIGGSWVEPSNPELLDSASPHDRSVVGRVVQARPADIDCAVAAARASFEAGVCTAMTHVGVSVRRPRARTSCGRGMRRP